MRFPTNRVKGSRSRALALLRTTAPVPLEKRGLGYDFLKEINPGLIMVRVTGYGQKGSYRHRLGILAEAYAGYAYYE